MTTYDPAYGDEVVVCPHWRHECADTAPVPLAYVDPRDVPVCDNDHPMTEVVLYPNWLATVGFR